MNNVLNKIAVLSDLVHKSDDATVENRSLLEFTLHEGKVSETLSTNNITFDSYSLGRFSIDLKQFSNDFIVFLDITSFRERTISDKSFLTEKNIVILIFENTYFFYEQNTKNSFVGGVLKEECFLVSNLICYLLIVDYLKSSNFADYFNTSSREIIIYSSTKGVLKLTIPTVPSELDYNINFEGNISNLIKKLDNSDFTIHFKNQLFSLDKKANENQITALFNHITSLIQEAENNYQLQLKNFSFEKFKNDLQKEKEKYFSSLREILNKILGQIIGVPISIAASTFASYKIESELILYLVLFAFATYVFFAIHFQLIYKKDITEIEKDFNKDFKKIKDDSGLKTEDINDEQLKIERRIKSIKRTITAFIICVLLLAVSFTFYLINQIVTYNDSPNKETAKAIKSDTLRVIVVSKPIKDTLTKTQSVHPALQQGK